MKAILVLSSLFLLLLSVYAEAIEGDSSESSEEEQPLGFAFSLKEEKDAFGWKFPKNRPYHYFKSTKDIPANFLPIKPEEIPEGNGVWVLRHKDFKGEPRTFRSRAKNLLKSTISFSTNSLLFHNVTLKVFMHGYPDLRLDFHDGIVSGPGQDGSMAVLEYGNCEDSDYKEAVKWTLYTFEIPPASHMNLDVMIHHEDAFVILDEVTLRIDPATRTTTTTTPPPKETNICTIDEICCTMVH